MNSERIIITGGAGFIGRALIARCLGEGAKVAVVDNLCVGRIDNLKPYLDKIEFFEADILDETSLNAVMEKVKPGIVFHLAAHHFIPFCDEHPSETLRVNVEGTFSVLNAAARHGVATAVVASSGALYPSRDALLGEDLQPAPSDIYGLSKHMAEQVTQFIASTTGVSCVAARLFNTYGPHETNAHLIPHIMSSLRGGPTVELGNIHTKRDYIYVDDVAECLYRCGQAAPPRYTTVNVGTGMEYSAEEIVQTISQILNCEISIAIGTSRVRNVDKLNQRADIQRLLSLTDMRPHHSLSDGLRKLLAHERIGRPQFRSVNVDMASI